MKLTNLAVQSSITSAFVGNLRNADDMKAFWNDPKNKTIISIGRFLRNTIEGKSLAQHLLDGAEIELSQVTVDGFVYPLKAGYRISLKDLSAWGCPACGSAHGTAYGKSAGVSKGNQLALLESNKWYYNPATQAMFVISFTCWGTYVKATGDAKHIVTPFDLKPAPAKPALEGVKK